LGHVAQLVGAWVPSSNWPTDQFQGTKPVRLRVRPATEGTQPHHRRETFLQDRKQLLDHLLIDHNASLPDLDADPVSLNRRHWQAHGNDLASFLAAHPIQA